MEEKVELVCEGCNQKYRLRVRPEEVREDLLFCPQCGGKLNPSSQASKTLRPKDLSQDLLEDLLITGPVALVYWDLSYPKEPVEDLLKEEGYTLKGLADTESLRYWLRLFIPKVMVWGTEDETMVSSFEEVLGELSMPDYRRIFRLWVSPRFRTLDPLQTFLAGVHLICHPEDLERFPEIYHKAQEYWQRLYEPYHKAYQRREEVE